MTEVKKNFDFGIFPSVLSNFWIGAWFPFDAFQFNVRSTHVIVILLSKTMSFFVSLQNLSQRNASYNVQDWPLKVDDIAPLKIKTNFSLIYGTFRQGSRFCVCKPSYDLVMCPQKTVIQTCYRCATAEIVKFASEVDFHDRKVRNLRYRKTLQWTTYNKSLMLSKNI